MCIYIYIYICMYVCIYLFIYLFVYVLAAGAAAAEPGVERKPRAHVGGGTGCGASKKDYCHYHD